MTRSRRSWSTPSSRPRTRTSSAITESTIAGLIGAVFDYGEDRDRRRPRAGRIDHHPAGREVSAAGLELQCRPQERARRSLPSGSKSTLSKQQILEIYLNSIFLGRNAYGVQAAARAYFDKDVNELTLPEAAYLAVLPKAPSNYDPVRATQKALDRRNYVLREMYRNGYITEDQWKAAAATPLGTIRYGSNEKFQQQGGYFMEEVRRELIKRFGENAQGRTEQPLRRRPVGALLDGPDDAGRRRAGAARRPGQVRRRPRLEDLGISIDLPKAIGRRSSTERRSAPAIPTGRRPWSCRRATAKRRSASRTARPAACLHPPRRCRFAVTAAAAFDSLKPGMVIIVKQTAPGSYQLRSIPEISGGMLVEEVHTGRVLAMQGGFDVRRIELQSRHSGAPPAWLGVQADRLCRPRSRTASRRRRSSSTPRSASTRAPVSATNASSTSTAGRPARTPCAGASSSRAT